MKIQLQTNNNETENRVIPILNNIILKQSNTGWLHQTTGKMKNIFLSLLFFAFYISTTKAQCSTYVQMALTIENCLVPVIVSSQQILMPCSAPTGYYQLLLGDFAYIDYTPSGCITTCILGLEVDITCYTPTVGIENQEPVNEIKIFPNPFSDNTSFIIQSKNLNETYSFELMDVLGKQVRSIKEITAKEFQISRNGLPNGIYFYKIYTPESVVSIGKLAVE